MQPCDASSKVGQGGKVATRENKGGSTLLVHSKKSKPSKKGKTLAGGDTQPTFLNQRWVIGTRANVLTSCESGATNLGTLINHFNADSTHEGEVR